jgi:hypothetical protein
MVIVPMAGNWKGNWDDRLGRMIKAMRSGYGYRITNWKPEWQESK